MPKVAGWHLVGVPVTFDLGEVARLLASCDRRTTFGRRDCAVLVVLSRLGLRAGEVAALDLADIDWRAGELVVRGKGRRAEGLPLPVAVGEALAGCVRDGRRSHSRSCCSTSSGSGGASRGSSGAGQPPGTHGVPTPRTGLPAR
ncbi:MAG: tyrosine-type recombinase/integrase [Egibacteraceae bacterium]